MDRIDELQGILGYVHKTRDDVDERKFRAGVGERAGMTRMAHMVERRIEKQIAARGVQKQLRDAA